jgi:inward rectifier potassium channel
MKRRRSRLRQRTVKIEKRDGKFEIAGFGKWYYYWRDPYHLMILII